MIIWLFFWLAAFWNHFFAVVLSLCLLWFHECFYNSIILEKFNTSIHPGSVTTRQSSKPARLRRSKVTQVNTTKTQQLYTIWKDFQNTWEEFSIWCQEDIFLLGVCLRVSDIESLWLWFDSMYTQPICSLTFAFHSVWSFFVFNMS